MGLVTAYRHVGDEINAKLAQTEAEILHEAVKEKKGSHEEAIRILTTRSKTQLIATFNRYRETHGTSITKVCKNLKLRLEFENFGTIIHHHLNLCPFYFYRSCWMKNPMIFKRHCIPPFVVSMIMLSTMKRYKSFFFSN